MEWMNLHLTTSQRNRPKLAKPTTQIQMTSQSLLYQDNMDEKEVTFTQELFKCYVGKHDRLLLPQIKLEQFIQRIDLMRRDPTTKKTREDYYLLKRYDILKIGNLSKLIRKQESTSDEVKYFVSIEETYDIIKQSHEALNHAGRDRMLKELKKTYANITEMSVMLFKSLCEECQRSQLRYPNKGSVGKPTLSTCTDFTKMHFQDEFGPTAEFPDPLPVDAQAAKKALSKKRRRGLAKTLAEAAHPNSKTPDYASSNVRPVFMCGKEKQDSPTEQKKASDNGRKAWRKGNRLINLALLLDSLKRCQKCGFGPVPLSCASVKGEHRVGLGGYLLVQCGNPTCQEVNKVAYSKMKCCKSADGEKLQYFDVNSKLNTAKIDRLGDLEHINEILSTLDLGSICSSNYDNIDLIGGTSTRLTTDPIFDADTVIKKEIEEQTQTVSTIIAETGRSEGLTSKGGTPLTNGRGIPVYLAGPFHIQGGGKTLTPAGGSSLIKDGGSPPAKGGGTTISQGSRTPLSQGGGTILSRKTPVILGGGTQLIVGGAGTPLVVDAGGNILHQGGGTQLSQKGGTPLNQSVGAPFMLGSGGSPLILGDGRVGTILSLGGGNHPTHNGRQGPPLTLGGEGIGGNPLILGMGPPLTQTGQATNTLGRGKIAIQKEDKGCKRTRNTKNMSSKRLKFWENVGITNKRNSDRTEESISDTAVKCTNASHDEKALYEKSSVGSDDGEKVGKSKASVATIKCESVDAGYEQTLQVCSYPASKLGTEVSFLEEASLCDTVDCAEKASFKCESVDAEYEQTCEEIEEAGICDTVEDNFREEDCVEKSGISSTTVKYECVDPEYEKQVIFDRIEDSIADTSVKDTSAKGKIVDPHYDQQHVCISDSTAEGLSYKTVKCEVDDSQYEQQHEVGNNTEESDTGQ